MKNFFNNLFAIFTQQDTMTKHSKIMFFSTLFSAVILGLICPLWVTLLITIIIMLLYEIAFVYVPTRKIKILFFKINFFDFERWQSDLIDNVFDKHNDMNKLDFYNICAGLFFYLVYVLITILI